MKPPDWLVIAPKSAWRREGNQVVFTVRLSRYFWAHPGFWWFLLRNRRVRP